MRKLRSHTVEDHGEGVLERGVALPVRVDELMQEDERLLLGLGDIAHLRQHVVHSSEVLALRRVHLLDGGDALEVFLLRQHRLHLRRERVALGAHPVGFEVGHLGALEALVARNVERRYALPVLVRGVCTAARLVAW
jgi:hypothetical protein